MLKLGKHNPTRERDAELRKRFGAITNELDLGNLGLNVVPEKLREVSDVEILSLAGNRIRELPRWIKELSALKAFELGGNQLRTLPSEISALSGLVGLYLSDNRLEMLPETLSALPLKELVVHGNPGLGLPTSILVGGRTEEILRYYFGSRGKKGTPLLELKLLLVGRGRAGKTTLVKRLAGEEPDEHESETHSISIRELMLSCKRGQVRARAWDFGGQEILHATHYLVPELLSEFEPRMEERWDKAPVRLRYRYEVLPPGFLPRFIASQTSLVRPYIKDPELRRARERHAKCEVEIVTVMLEPCACDEDPFPGRLQRLAPRFKSIAQAKLKSDAWEQVRKDLLPVIKRVRQRKDGTKG